VDDSPAHGPASPGPRRRWDFRLVTQRILVPAAAVVVLAAGGFGLSRVTGSSSSSSATSGSEAVPATSARSASGAAAAPNETPSRSGGHPAIEAPLNFPIVNSGINYKRATLRQQLETELARHTESAAGPQVLMSASLKGCVLRVTHGTRPGTLALVERARFQSQPAIVIVAVSGDHKAAWVTASGCSASSDHVLATATLPGTSAS